MLLGDRVDLAMKKIKLIISSEITIIDRGEIQLSYFLDKHLFTEMRVVLFEIVEGSVIYFKIFDYQKLREMIG